MIGALMAAMAEDCEDWAVTMEECAPREERRLPMSPSDEAWYAPGGDWDDEDTSDDATAPSAGRGDGGMGMTPIREDGFMWDALMGGGAR